MRINGKRVVVIADCSGKILRAYACKSSQLVHIRDVRVEFYGVCDIILGSFEIVKVELCQSTVKPRFIEMRFCRNGLVEVLYGKNIILIIERTPAGYNEPAGVELRLYPEPREKSEKGEDYSVLHAENGQWE